MTNGQETLWRGPSVSANFHTRRAIARLPWAATALITICGDIVFVVLGCLIGLAPLQHSAVAVTTAIAAISAVVLLYLIGLYRSRLTLSLLDDLSLLALASIGAAVAAGYLFDHQQDSFGLRSVTFVATGIFVFMAAWRAISYEVVYRLRARGLIGPRI